MPIVFTSVSDPIGTGFVESFSRPGGMITGFTNFEASMGIKWLELMHDLAPSLNRGRDVVQSDDSQYGCKRWHLSAINEGFPLAARDKKRSAHACTRLWSSKTVGALHVQLDRLFWRRERSGRACRIAAYLGRTPINRSLRILSRARSCSAITVPGDQLGGGSYVCTLRNCDYYFTGIPAGQCGKPQRGDGQEFRSWQSLRIQLF
jgi:hypothetical protein